MDRGHGWIEEQGSDEGAVNVVDSLKRDQKCQSCARSRRSMNGPTNKAAMSQLAPGRCSIPFFWGRVNMIYSSVMKPGASIVANPIFPGMFKRDCVEVLPIGYQVVTNCIEAN